MVIWTNFLNACNIKGPSFQDTEIGKQPRVMHELMKNGSQNQTMKCGQNKHEKLRASGWWEVKVPTVVLGAEDLHPSSTLNSVAPLSTAKASCLGNIPGEMLPAAPFSSFS
ncbi:hypothetical protein EJB05_01001, partial [Eragrostis curvula]